MPVARARIVDVLEKISAGLLRDAREAAGNSVLSKAEQAAMPAGLLKDAAEEARWREAPNGRVQAGEVAALALQQVEQHLKQINQATGAGAAFLSREEIARLQGVNGESAQRAARAYELITGKRVVLDGAVPTNPPSALPDAARVALTDVLVDSFGLARAARMEITNVRAQDGGYAFDVKTNVFEGSLFARDVDGRMLVASKPFDAALVRKVAQDALTYFDDSFKADMEQWGASAAEIAAAREAFVPSRFLLAGEDDPHGYTQDYAFVMQIENETGSDHGVYAGANDAASAVDIYAFN